MIPRPPTRPTKVLGYTLITTSNQCLQDMARHSGTTPVCLRTDSKASELFYTFRHCRVYMEACWYPNKFHGVDSVCMFTCTTFWTCSLVGWRCAWDLDYCLPTPTHLHQSLPYFQLWQVPKVLYGYWGNHSSPLCMDSYMDSYVKQWELLEKWFQKLVGYLK